MYASQEGMRGVLVCWSQYKKQALMAQSITIWTLRFIIVELFQRAPLYERLRRTI